jgi:alkanesulfonate monooxygenase SsuD/methylene tetrahydromethanopterin reductase-like flavin-dependent oxidoreductase (luciferase family)
MIGARGEQMLSKTLPYVEQWNGWYAWGGNTVAGYRPYRELVDRVCGEVGRDPAAVERTLALDLHMPESDGKHDPRSTPLSGSPEQIAEALRAYAAEGISHMQIVLSPNTARSVEQFARVIEVLDR